MEFWGIFPIQILPMLKNFQLELKNDNKHRFFLASRKVLINGYFFKYFALELITRILVYVYHTACNQKVIPHKLMV